MRSINLQIDLNRLDRESIARLELRSIVDAMMDADEAMEGDGGDRRMTMVERMIREWMEERAELAIEVDGEGMDGQYIDGFDVECVCAGTGPRASGRGTAAATARERMGR